MSITKCRNLRRENKNAREGARRIYRAIPLGFIMAAKKKVCELFDELLKDE
jgi:hypothetical protein